MSTICCAVAGVSRAGGAIWRTAHSRAHTVLRFLSLALARSVIPHPPPHVLPPSSHFSSPSVFVSLPLSVSFLSSRPVYSVHRGGPQAPTTLGETRRKDHLVLYIVAPAAIILQRAFKNIRRSCWISRRKSVKTRFFSLFKVLFLYISSNIFFPLFHEISVDNGFYIIVLEVHLEVILETLPRFIFGMFIKWFSLWWCFL